VDSFKKIEQDLILEWHKIHLEKAIPVRDKAIKAYYAKYRLYRLQKVRQYVFAAMETSVNDVS
jgi:hypothetical protein